MTKRITASVAGQTGVGKQNGQHNLHFRLVREPNNSKISLNGCLFTSLIDSGSMVTTISENGLNSLSEKPQI